MGLLDDAIREHLELKRLKGADPGEVAREEHEALGPLMGEGQAGHDGYGSASEQTPEYGHADGPEHRYGDEDPYERAIGQGPEQRASDLEQLRPADPASAGQETVEFDMGSVLHHDRASTASDPMETQGVVPGERETVDNAASVAQTHHAAPASEDSLEGGVPGEQDASADEDAGEPHDGPNDEGAVEDVLEETPDFLRETPEQERLWFEQRPPRDFDFNE